MLRPLNDDGGKKTKTVSCHGIIATWHREREMLKKNHLVQRRVYEYARLQRGRGFLDHYLHEYTQPGRTFSAGRVWVAVCL